MVEAIDVVVEQVDELVAHVRSSRELCPKDEKELGRFHEFHKKNPQILEFLCDEIQLWLDRGRTSFSYDSLWNYGRWTLELESEPTETYKMNDHILQAYGRVIVILHPEYNGRSEFRPANVDTILGLAIASEKLPGHYAKRLTWADGTEIENGWRPTVPHVPTRAARRKPSLH